MDAGAGAVTREDEVYCLPRGGVGRLGIPAEAERLLIDGQDVRDWSLRQSWGLWPYDERTLEPRKDTSIDRALWRWRRPLSERVAFGKTQLERGLPWTGYSMFFPRRYVGPSIAMAFVATHNHFVFDEGGKVFNRSAPVVKLPEGSNSTQHFSLLGVLNSSVACFWLKQVTQPKGGGGIGRGVTVDAWEQRREFNSSNIRDLPLPSVTRPDLPAELHRLAEQRASRLREIERLLDAGLDAFSDAHTKDTDEFERMVSLQEELDWEMLVAYGLVPDELPRAGVDAPSIAPGERAFEIVLARSAAETTWFTRHGSTPITEVPSRWPESYRSIVERRISLIEADRDVRLVERPDNKRRWSESSWGTREREALRTFLLDAVEAVPDWSAGRLMSCAQITDQVSLDDRVRVAAQRYAGTVDVDLEAVLTSLITEEAVPYLAARRHTEAGLSKRAEWDAVWNLQRREDAGEAVGEIPLPPRFGDKDWRSARFKQLRGKLDVPKERFTSVPDGQRTGDPSPVIGWAGWDDAELAFALAGRVTLLRDQDGAGADRLVPLLAGIAELLPWVRQWHTDPDPDTGQPPHGELEAFVRGELGRLELTADDLKAWRPPAQLKRGRRKATA